MKFIAVLLFLFLQRSVVQPKPLHSSKNDEINQISFSEKEDDMKLNTVGQESANSLSTSLENIEPHSTKINEEIEHQTIASEVMTDKFQEWLSWLFGPLFQQVQFSTQSLLRDKLLQVKRILNNLSSSSTTNGKGKQLDSVGGLVHLLGPYDSDFYTDRLEQAGFFGGNGWFANKGGILGGPGSLLSTGSLLTDYLTAYRK